MNFFALDYKKIVFTLALIVVPLLAINMEHNPEEKPTILQPFAFVAGLVQNAYSGFSSGVRGTTSLYLNLVDIKRNNRILVKKNSELRAKLGAVTELKLENERLNELLGFQQKTKMELLAAKVIGKDLIPDHNTITINRGSHHGIKQNMAAITTGGVVGYVIENQTFTSQILLLTDRYASIDSIVQRSRARGIIEGQSQKLCHLSYLQREDDVIAGDLIVTSGLDNIFPKGFPVGTVIQVSKNRYDISQKVDVKPIVNPFSLEELFIVLNANGENFDKNEKDGESDAEEPKKESEKTPQKSGEE